VTWHVKNWRPTHPRLFLTKDRTAALHGQVASDPVAAGYLADLKKHATPIPEQPPVKRETDNGGTILGQSRCRLRQIGGANRSRTEHPDLQVNTREATVWFDHVVVSRQHVGPLKPAPSAEETPK
jgi:hypothetical protein